MATQTISPADGANMFLNEHESRTVAAIADRVFPPDASGPGASEIGAVVYIDRALAGYGRHLQRLYRRGVSGLDKAAQATSSGKLFADLSDQQKDDFIRRFLEPENSGEANQNGDAGLLAEFLGAVRLHTMEGVFCDPMYGGNRDSQGWKLIGFPGAQWGYSPEQMKLGYDATKIPMKTLADLRREHFPNGHGSGGRTS